MPSLIPILVLLAGLLGSAGCTLKSNLPEMGTVPRFSLASHTGEAYVSEALAGKIWVADFIFTTCQGPCPRMTAQMRKLQGEVKDLDDVRLVSFTVDPENDTVAALAAYAKRFGADQERWRFLTGTQQELQRLSMDTFHLSDTGGPLEHSTRFVLVDQKSRIRGYYDSTDPESHKQLVEDIGKLRKEVF